MKKPVISWVIIAFSGIFILFGAGMVHSQDLSNPADQIYGLDQTLCNGKKYTFMPPPGTSGNQYLLSPAYIAGRVTIHEKNYPGVLLNYDICNQLLLLQYASENGTWNNIEVSKAWLQGFQIGTMNFEYLTPEREPHLYQVLGQGQLRILCFWWKSLTLNAAIGSSNYLFSSPSRDTYLLINGKLMPFRSNRSMVRLFNPEHRSEIKNYLRKNKIKVNKSPDKVLEEMITYIGNFR
ncbi:MAG: hypothetical protein ACOYNC_14000 [Bacteroidales bacterium]